MSILRYLQSILLFLPALVLAAKPLGHEICVAACYNALKAIEFADQPGGDGTSCLNDLRVRSTYACARVRCIDQDLEPGISWWQLQCKHSSKVITVAQYHSTVDKIPPEAIRSLPQVKFQDKGDVDETVVPSNDAWDLVYGTLHAYDHEQHLHNTFRWIPYAFWALILATIAGGRIVNHIPFRTWTAVYYQHFTLAPAFGHRFHRTFGWLTGGTRLQALTVLCYITIHVAIVAVQYPTMEENIYYKSREIQRLRYVSDRSGVLLSGSLPFIWLFGTRNNFFLWASGLSFSTVQIFHRWVSLVFAIETIIHGSCFTAYYIQQTGNEGYKDELRDPLFICGILAATTVWTMILISYRRIRQAFYEFFKITHILLSIVVLVAYQKHVVGQFRGMYLVFLWVCVGLWCFDHASRMLRILIVNWPTSNEKGTNMCAHVTYIPAADIIRLSIPEARNAVVRPGSYYFLSLPSSSWRIWEQHPFSAIPMFHTSSTSALDISSIGPSPPGLSQKEKETTTDALPLGSVDSCATSKASRRSGITFMIRPKKGMTVRLRNRLLASSPHSISLRVLLEGPYGSHPLPVFDPSRFSSVLLIAGGTGITATIPYLHSIIDTCHGDSSKGNSKAKRVSLVWVAREGAFIRDVLENELHAFVQIATNQEAMNESRVDIRLFATQGSQKLRKMTRAISITSPSTSEGSSKSSLSFADRQMAEKDTEISVGKDAVLDAPKHNSDSTGPVVIFARPNIGELISAFSQPKTLSSSGASSPETKLTTEDSKTVFICGPMRLAEEARHATRQQARTGVKYFEQVYGW